MLTQTQIQIEMKIQKKKKQQKLFLRSLNDETDKHTSSTYSI